MTKRELISLAYKVIDSSYGRVESYVLYLDSSAEEDIKTWEADDLGSKLFAKVRAEGVRKALPMFIGLLVSYGAESVKVRALKDLTTDEIYDLLHQKA